MGWVQGAVEEKEEKGRRLLLGQISGENNPKFVASYIPKAPERCSERIEKSEKLPGQLADHESPLWSSLKKIY